jgi:hypothetical protein
VVLRHLAAPLPSPTAAPPAGYALVESTLTQGLPARFPLGPRLTLAVTVPTGLARAWVRADPALVVSSSDEPSAAGIADAGRVPIRVVLLADGGLVGAAPLVRAVEVLLPGAPDRPVEVAVVALGWRVTAGALVGPGGPGSWLRLAWRRVGAAADRPSRIPARPAESLPVTATGYAPPRGVPEPAS